ncbi:MAG TPA: hypothetical protein VFO57_07245, partial [Burkholderiales bacterium]|nr:hypothetical protein [Burkholderiales bacterium]
PITVGGDMTVSTLTSTSTVTYNGTGAQVIGGGVHSYTNLTINKAGGTATFASNAQVAGDLTLTAGTLDLATFTANRTAAGGTITVGTGATLIIGGTNTFPANYTTATLGATSTVNYNGTAQNVANAVGAPGYGHLTLSGSSTKTALGTFTVRGDLSISSVTFAGDTFTHTVNGNVSNTGTHTVSTGNITLSGGAAVHSLTGAGTYGNLILNDANGATLGGSPTLSGTLTLTSGTFAVGANKLTLNGPNTAGTTSNMSTTASSSLEFGGISAGVSIPSGVVQLLDLTINNSNGITLASSPIVNGTLTFISGNLNTTAANTLSIESAGSISGAAPSQHVVGNLARVFPATAGTSFTYAVGDGTNFTPVTITFPAAPTTGSLTVATPGSPAADHPDTTGETSGIDAAKSINRYWTLKGSTLNGTCTAAFNYIDGTPVDRDSGATAASFVIRRGATCSGSGGGRTCTGWGLLTLSGAPNNTLATATGVSISSGDPESDFVVGEAAVTRFSREKEFIYTRELY